jgi:hypothetical protein
VAAYLEDCAFATLLLDLGFAGQFGTWHDRDASAQFERHVHDAADVLDAGLLIFRDIKAVAQWTIESRDLLIERAQEILQFAPSGVRQPFGRKIAEGIELNAAKSELCRVRQAVAHRHAH